MQPVAFSAVKVETRYGGRRPTCPARRSWRRQLRGSRRSAFYLEGAAAAQRARTRGLRWAPVGRPLPSHAATARCVSGDRALVHVLAVEDIHRSRLEVGENPASDRALVTGRAVARGTRGVRGRARFRRVPHDD